MATYGMRIIGKLIRTPVCNQNLCYYSRWTHRTPRRVIIPGEEKGKPQIIKNNPKVMEINQQSNFDNEAEHNRSLRRPVKPVNLNFDSPNLVDVDELELKTNLNKKYNKEPKATQKKNKAKKENVLIESHTFKEDGELVYEHLLKDTTKIGQLMLQVKSRKHREKMDSILLEGKRLILDGLMAGCELQTLLFSRDRDVEFFKNELPKSGVQIYKVPYKEIKMWSDLTTCPGVMGIFKMPNTKNHKPSEDSIPVTVICDNVREPGNLGAILRAAAAVGCQQMLLTKGTVGLWDTKVLRSAAGAHFRMPIVKDFDWSEIDQYVNEESAVFIADNSVTLQNLNKIPEQQNPKEDPVAETDVAEVDVTDECIDSKIPAEEIMKIPVVSHFDVVFSNCNSIVIVIGGETEGISEEAYSVVFDNSGLRLHVPLSNGIESLNTGTALGIILFEIKRQLLLNKNTSTERVSNIVR